MNTTQFKSRQSGTNMVPVGAEDREVPHYLPGRGQSADDVARERGLRCLGRREQGDVVATVGDGAGHTFRCVVSP